MKDLLPSLDQRPRVAVYHFFGSSRVPVGDVFEPYNGGVVRRWSMRIWDTLSRAGTRSVSSSGHLAILPQNGRIATGWPADDTAPRSRRFGMRRLVAGFAAASPRAVGHYRSTSQSVCASRRSVHWAVEKGSMPAGDGSSAARASRCPRLGDRAARDIESASRAKSVSAVHGGAPRRAADPFRYSTRRHPRCRPGAAQRAPGPVEP